MFKIFRAETADVFPGITPRNKAAYDYETFTHRMFYPYIIHPYSRFRVYYELVFLVIIPINSIFFYFIWFFLDHNKFAYNFLTLFIQFINLIDIISRFLTGYVEKNTEIVVLSPKLIARKYILGLFVLDLLSVIPWEVFSLFIDKKCTFTRIYYISEHCQLATFLTITSFSFRIFTFVRYSKNIWKIMSWNPYFRVLFSIPYFYIQVILLHISLLFLYAYMERNIWEGSSLEEELTGLLNILALFVFDITFLGTAIPEIKSTSQFPLLLFSFLFSIFFTGYFIKYILGKMKAKENLYLMESRVKRFAKKRHLPIILKHKTLLYFHILLQNKYHKEKEIFHYVPDTFKAEIFYHFCLPLLKGFHAFEDFPTYVLRRLAERLKYQLYLPNQRIIRKNEYKLSMYFIQRGTVALYSPKNVELYHFEAGSSVNGRYMIEGKSTGKHFVISIEVTEAYRLDHKDFIEIMESYPKLMNQVKEKLHLNREETRWI